MILGLEKNEINKRILDKSFELHLQDSCNNISVTLILEKQLTCVSFGKYSAMFQLETMSISLSPSEESTFCVLA